MQHLDAMSLGVYSYLEVHERVSRVESKPLVGATEMELQLWEQKNSPHVFPDDLKHFYYITNGLSVKWFATFCGKVFAMAILNLQSTESECNDMSRQRTPL